MGFFKEFGGFLGEFAGAMLSAPFNIASELTGNKTLSEIGDGIFQATSNTGNLIGTTADATIGTVTAALNSDGQKFEQSLHELGGVV